MIPYIIGNLAPKSTYYTKGLVKYFPGRELFRAVPSQNGDKFATSPLFVEQLWSGCWPRVALFALPTKALGYDLLCGPGCARPPLLVRVSVAIPHGS